MDPAAVNTTVDEQAGDVEKPASAEVSRPNSADYVSEGYLPGAKVSLGKKQFWIVILG